MSHNYKLTLSIIAENTGPVSTIIPAHTMGDDMVLEDYGYMIGPQLTATHTFQNAPALDILLVPGGAGNLVLDQEENTSVEDFVAKRYKQLDYLLSVCTGSKSLAKSGVLDGKRATTNKRAWDEVTQFGTGVEWVPSARWVEDGNIWTSSGVAAGKCPPYLLHTCVPLFFVRLIINWVQAST